MGKSNEKPESTSVKNEKNEQEISSKELRKMGEDWQPISIETDEELLRLSRAKDVFTLPNPGNAVCF